MSKKTDLYYEKYFPDGKEIKESEHHMLNIWLDDDAVTRDDLLKAGFVEGKDEDDDECDFYVDEEELLVVPPLCVPINGDVGIEQEDLDKLSGGLKVLPDGWEEGVPELIGFKPEWIDGVSMDG